MSAPDSRAEAAALVTDLRAAGVQAEAFAADMAEPGEIEGLFAAVDARFGRLDGLVNSAGIGLPHSRIADLDAAGLQRLMAVNVVGVMLCCRAAVRQMSTASGGQGGVIVTVGSMAGTIGGRPGNAHYAASKAALDSFNVGLAKDVAVEGIRAIVVRPGVIRTDMTSKGLADPRHAATVAASIPMGRPGTADEAAAPIAWLMSGEASFITGCTLDISGGGFHIASAG